MKNLKMFKKVSIIFLGLVFTIVCSGKVFAADEGLFTPIDTTNNTSNSATDGNNTPNTNADANNNANNNVNNNIVNGSLTTNNANNANNSVRNANESNTNRNVSNTATLAKTGLPNTGAIIAVVLVVCGISAIYSYKKVNDYKKL